MKRRRIGLALFLAFSAGVVPAFAQAPVPPADPAAAATPPPPAEPKWYEPVAGPFKIEGSAGSLKLGLLFQPQFESIGSPALDGMANNFFVRRTRILVGATLFTNLDFFFETDFANMFRVAVDSETGQKPTPTQFIQDAFFTYKFLGDALKVDVGYMLPPLAHNALQSAASLYGWDYFANSFRHSGSFNTSADPAGRDLGFELRGLVANGLLEYRAGLYQGLREPAVPMVDAASQNMFRAIGRVQINLMDPETGFFYAGTYLGAKKIVSLGGSFDIQDDYKHWSADGFVDLPLGPGVLTAQVNVAGWDGGDFIAALPKQMAIMGEAGFTFVPVGIAPIVRFEMRDLDAEGAQDETRIGGGLAYFAHGHNFNLKAFFTNIKPDPGDAYNAINVQAQVYAF